ncbi:hypothetical protein, partial [Halomonas sp. ND22Bw]|uniref:hypothetical protein n=1 Tax=Halomonas sp. ND22Bw TaxID=2054178 RepID=UPI001C63247E
ERCGALREPFLVVHRRLIARECLDGEEWAAAGFKDTLLRWKMKPEVVHGNEKAVQPRVQA